MIVVARRLLLAALVALAVGCRKDTPPAPEAPALPQRIASQTILSDEVLYALGDTVRPRVVAVSRLADDANYSAVAGLWPAAVDRSPLTGEALLAVDADLVIIADFTAVETRELLQRAGIPTLTLTGFSGFADWRRNVQAIGDAVGDTAGGQALVRSFDADLAAASAPAGGEGAWVVSWSAGNVAGSGTTFDDVANAAGLRNLAAKHGITGHKPVTVEQLVAWDPAVLVVPCEGVEADACAAVAKEVAGQSGIASTTAARQGRVLAVPSAILYSAGAGMIEAVRLLRAPEDRP